MSQNSETGKKPLTHSMQLQITLAQGECPGAIKMIHITLGKKGMFPSEDTVSLT